MVRPGSSTWHLVRVQLRQRHANNRVRKVEKLFRMFDLDGDGLLNKREFKRYLEGIGAWGTHSSYLDDKAFDEFWPTECSNLGSDLAGIRASEFEGRLYGKVRRGLLDRDIHAATAAVVAYAKNNDERADRARLLSVEDKRLAAEERAAAAFAKRQRHAQAIRKRSAFPSWSGDSLCQLKIIEATRRRAQLRSMQVSLQENRDRQRSRGNWSVPFSHAVYARYALRAPKRSARVLPHGDTMPTFSKGRNCQPETHAVRISSARHSAIAELAASSARARVSRT